MPESPEAYEEVEISLSRMIDVWSTFQLLEQAKKNERAVYRRSALILCVLLAEIAFMAYCRTWGPASVVGACFAFTFTQNAAYARRWRRKQRKYRDWLSLLGVAEIAVWRSENR